MADAGCTLVNTRPTTLAGILALCRYIEPLFGETDQPDLPDHSTHPASTPGRRDGLPRSAQAATAALNCWFAFQFHGSRSATLLAG